MNKWTQEQRDAACGQFKMFGFSDSVQHMSEPNLDATIEILCQRNELLNALKAACDIMQREIPWNAEKNFRAIIAKAEAQ